MAFILRKWGAPRRCGFVSNLNFNAKKLFFHSFWNPKCVHMLMYVFADLEHAYAYACLHTHALGFPWPYFPKIVLFSS